MRRPSGGADRQLIEVAKKIVRKKGCSGLRIRDLTDQAGVNLGMFHYHFQNKKRFERILLQEVYEEFFAQLSFVAAKEGDSLNQLRNAMLVIGKFLRDNRGLVVSLITDLLNGKTEVLKFGRKNVPRHASLILNLLERCQEERKLPDIPFPLAMSFIMGALNMPVLVAHIVEKIIRTDACPADMLISDEAIAQRVEMIITGLRLLKRE